MAQPYMDKYRTANIATAGSVGITYVANKLLKFLPRRIRRPHKIRASFNLPKLALARSVRSNARGALNAAIAADAPFVIAFSWYCPILTCRNIKDMMREYAVDKNTAGIIFRADVLSGQLHT
mmetsp:Transcript_5825/g.14565  ORF Transcript_5825/g.14565 Transcript_5825/m.14565 type:complete len:122 (-) Transcript_5825:411-776(-)